MVFKTMSDIQEEIAQQAEESAKPAVEGIEKLAADMFAFDLSTKAQISMAISLKRIADFVAGGPRHDDIVAYLRREFEGARR